MEVIDVIIVFLLLIVANFMIVIVFIAIIILAFIEFNYCHFAELIILIENYLIVTLLSVIYSHLNHVIFKI